jgi:hypothetical protein
MRFNIGAHIPTMVLSRYNIDFSFNHFISGFPVYLYLKSIIQHEDLNVVQLHILFNHYVHCQLFHSKTSENAIHIQVESRESLQRIS